MTTRLTTEIPLRIREQDLLHFLFHFSTQSQYSLAAWQLPGDSYRRIVVSRNTRFLKKEELLEELPAGFIFSPFDPKAESCFIPGEFQFTVHDDMVTAPKGDVETKSHEWLRDNYRVFPEKEISSPYYSSPVETNNTHPDFMEIVRQGVSAVEKGIVEKVVPSRCKQVTLPRLFDLGSSFLKLCKAYPQAFVSIVSSPETGTWLGATPEELVRVQDKTIFRTVALAGTQPFHEGVNLRNVAWTQKEIEEQALVERYIISCFKKIRLREYDEHGPKTVVAGNLMHLRSDFTVNMHETNFPQLGSTMLQLLHPTSAVCGMPLQPSLQFLQDHEGYSREFYSGYLGPVNIDNNIDIFVNLRCMQIIHPKAILYAGAGVTIDSVPEQEWEETEMKMNTLLRVIQ